MTASPPTVNGSARPTMPVIVDWRPDEPELVEEQCIPEPELALAEKPDMVAAAEAATIRARGEAEAEAIRLAAEADAKARIIAAEEEARKQRLVNDRAERKAREEEAASEARIADHNRRRDEAERARTEAAAEAEQQQVAAQVQAAEVAEAEGRWKGYAGGFYIVCAIVALPVQVAAFYDPKALWLMAAPLMLEGGAWVVLKGAAAAVAAHRPHWHYRLIAWLLAFIAAGINLWHGLNAFDPATAIGTAFASIAGPGVWDLHEHGRIRKRDGKLSWRDRRAAKKAATAEKKRKASEEKQRAVEKAAADKAVEAERQRLSKQRQEEFKDVWPEAVKIAAAVGSTTDDDAVWVRAYRNIKGCDPGESIESITARRAAEKRVQAALTGTPVNTLSKTTNAQRAIQIKNPSRRSSYKPVPPVRQPGDTPSYHPAARRAHGETKRRTNASKSSRPSDI